MVLVFIEHSIKKRLTSQQQVYPDMSLGELKKKVFMITGTQPQHQCLQLRNPDNGSLIRSLDGPDETKLLQFNIPPGFVIKCVDMDPFQGVAGISEDALGSVDKYEISEEDYENRSDTFREWKRKNIDQKEKDLQEKQIEEEKKRQEKHEVLTKEFEDKSVIGKRCEVQIVGKPRGVVKFVGKVHFKEGYFVGVQCDEPVGKNDGSVQKKRYFTCEPGYGLFCRQDVVNVGDYPEMDDFSGSDSDEI